MKISFNKFIRDNQTELIYITNMINSFKNVEINNKTFEQVARFAYINYK